MHANDNEGMKLSEGLRRLDEYKAGWKEYLLNLKQRNKLTFEERKYVKEELRDIETLKKELIDEYC